MLFTGELHRREARISPVNFTEIPRFLALVNTATSSQRSRSPVSTRQNSRPRRIARGFSIRAPESRRPYRTATL
jgi:hypothetical protein